MKTDKISVTITKRSNRYLEALVKEGIYVSKSEAVRAAIISLKKDRS